MSDQGRLLTANDAEPPVGSRVRALGQVWVNALDGGDQESDHGVADEILLQFVPEEVRAAWKAACDRVGFWYA